MAVAWYERLDDRITRHWYGEGEMRDDVLYAAGGIFDHFRPAQVVPAYRPNICLYLTVVFLCERGDAPLFAANVKCYYRESEHRQRRSQASISAGHEALAMPRNEIIESARIMRGWK